MHSDFKAPADFKPLDIAIIGAGMAGLAAARTMAAAGHDVALFDNGRGAGGRLSTRRTPHGSFDHGAQHVTVRDPSFSGYIAELQGKGAVHVWDKVRPGAIIGKPCMSALVKDGLEGQPSLSLTLSLEVAHVGKVAEGYLLSNRDGQHHGPFDAVILAVPGPQAAHLLAAFGPAFARLEDIRFAPSYTLMAAFDAPLDIADLPQLKEGGQLAAACRQGARGPHRTSAQDLWVVQASADFSQAHIEREREEMVPVLLRLMQEELCIAVPQPVFAAGHRWRYALVEQPLGEPFLLSADGTLGVAGDGMLGPRVELAFLSGAQCAGAMLERQAAR